MVFIIFSILFFIFLIMKKLLAIIGAVVVLGVVGLAGSRLITQPVKAFAPGTVETFTGTLETASVPYDHTVVGPGLNLVIGSKFDSLLNQKVNVTVTYGSGDDFTVDSITPVSEETPEMTATPTPTPMPSTTTTPTPTPATSTTEDTDNDTDGTGVAGMQETFTGILATDPSGKAQYILTGSNIQLDLGSAYNGWLGKDVSVVVQYTDESHFTVVSVTEM
jgi:hypothetical protein